MLFTGFLIKCPYTFLKDVRCREGSEYALGLTKIIKRPSFLQSHYNFSSEVLMLKTKIPIAQGIAPAKGILSYFVVLYILSE